MQLIFEDQLRSLLSDEAIPTMDLRSVVGQASGVQTFRRSDDDRPPPDIEGQRIAGEAVAEFLGT